MGSEKSRREKVHWIKNRIETFWKEKPKQTISKKSLLAIFGLQLASSERTGKEILRQLEAVEFINIEGDNITKGNKGNWS